MGMDCRGRIDGVANDIAGNYVTALTMNTDTFGTPAAVREMLSSQAYQTTIGPLTRYVNLGWFMFGRLFLYIVTVWISINGLCVCHYKS